MRSAALAGLDPCVHCGFCLQTCPTYLVSGDEAESPRGRIVLIKGLAAGGLALRDPTLALHLDHCLGCRACEPVCPSGVSYGPALEEVRRTLRQARPIPLSVRVVHSVMAAPWLRRSLGGVARTVRPLARSLAGSSRLGFALGMLGATRPPGNHRPPARRQGRPERTGTPNQQDPTPRGAVVLFRGCVMDDLFRHVHNATIRVLRANGFDVLDVRGQGCCGALHAHAGQHEAVVALAARNVRAFSPVPSDAPIIVNAAGCGAMLREYGRILGDGPLGSDAVRFADRVRDVSQVLASSGPRRGGPLALRVAYDPPCHLLHAQRIAAEPEQVLSAVPGIDRVRYDEAEVCCGSAGSYSFAQPEISRAVLARKIAAILSVRPDVVATGNPGCAMLIGAGLLAAGEAIPVLHPVELLDWSYAGAGYYGH